MELRGGTGYEHPSRPRSLTLAKGNRGSEYAALRLDTDSLEARHSPETLRAVSSHGAFKCII